MILRDKKVLIIGIARSGMAAARVLLKNGAQVWAYDQKTAAEIGSLKTELNGLGIETYHGEYSPINEQQFDLLVLSPGVPLDSPMVKAAFARNIKVIGELELAYLLKDKKVQMYAITGTNGKTTTTSLLQYILENSGIKSKSGGNIGVPLTQLVDGMSAGVIAVEVSSFQLETIREFTPHICGILNITPDHLDRHKTIETYAQIKAKILLNQKEGDYAILNYEDERIMEMAKGCRAKTIFFSTDQILNEGLFIKDNQIVIAIDGKLTTIGKTDEILLRGKHNLENVLCAVGMAFAAGVQPAVICASLSSFPGVRHRMEEVASIDGILYVNDSKATNPDSVIKALESFEQPIILIAGGRNKGFDFTLLAQEIKKRVKALILLGEAKKEIKAEVIQSGFANIHEVEDFATVVQKANQLASPGDVVLLSPACASWDMFPSYEHRGDEFCALVYSLNR